MRFNGEITTIKSSRGKKTMAVALTADTSLDALENYANALCEFEVGLAVQGDDTMVVDAVTGELVG